jgi:serine-type D-Ala-D-Ala endopeptidase (penicillin-binding protein 7)
VKAASGHPVIRDLSTSLGAVLPVGPKPKPVQFRNTNGLVHNPEWEIGLQKTGFISAAGRCVVMQAELAGRQLIMVLLDSAGRYSRIGDAERLRKWLSEQTLLPMFGRRADPLPEPVAPQLALPPSPVPAVQLPMVQPPMLQVALPSVTPLPTQAPLPVILPLSQPATAPAAALIDPAKPWVQVPALPLTVQRAAAEPAAQPR